MTLHGTRHHPLGQDGRVAAIGSDDAVSVGLTPATLINAIDAPGVFNNRPADTFEDLFLDDFLAEWTSRQLATVDCIGTQSLHYDYEHTWTLPDRDHQARSSSGM